MKLLAIETSSNACSVALYQGDILASHDFKSMTRGHSEMLMPMIEDVMKGAQTPMGALNAIAVSIGPGAFTGLRIGISSARALGLALNIPVYGIPTPKLIAAKATYTPSGPLMVALETKRSDLYIEVFPTPYLNNDNPQGLGQQALSLEAACLMAKDIIAQGNGPLHLAGDGAARLQPLLDQDNIPYIHRSSDNLPTANILGLVALAEIKKNPTTNPKPPEPLYIRPPDATLPSKPALILQGK